MIHTIMGTCKNPQRYSLEMWRGTILLAVAGASLCIYSYFTSNLSYNSPLLETKIFTILETVHLHDSTHGFGNDLPSYTLHFLSSAIFLGLLPLLAFCILGFRGNLLTNLALRRPQGKISQWKLFLPIWIILIVTSVLGAFDNGLANYYPYSKSLTVIEPSVIKFLIHAGSYLLFFYIPWELFFRGVLILPLLSILTDNPERIDKRSITIASIQAIPSSLLHFNHPLSESIAAVGFGVISGYLVLRYRSIWPSVILHASAGIILDLTLTLKAVF